MSTLLRCFHLRKLRNPKTRISENVNFRLKGLRLRQGDAVMNGISSYVISLVRSLSDFSVSISVLFLVQLYSIRHRYDIFATSFRIRLSEEAQGL
jgi:hypothetical protein